MSEIDCPTGPPQYVVKGRCLREYPLATNPDFVNFILRVDNRKLVFYRDSVGDTYVSFGNGCSDTLERFQQFYNCQLGGNFFSDCTLLDMLARSPLYSIWVVTDPDACDGGQRGNAYVYFRTKNLTDLPVQFRQNIQNCDPMKMKTHKDCSVTYRVNYNCVRGFHCNVCA